MVKFADVWDIPVARVSKMEDVRTTVEKMLHTPGPYLLDIITPHQEHINP